MREETGGFEKFQRRRGRRLGAEERLRRFKDRCETRQRAAGRAGKVAMALLALEGDGTAPRARRDEEMTEPEPVELGFDGLRANGKVGS